MSSPQDRIAKIGMSGTAGHLNALGKSGCVFLMTMTATEIKMKAESVPMFTRLASSSSGMNPPINADNVPKKRVLI